MPADKSKREKNVFSECLALRKYVVHNVLRIGSNRDQFWIPSCYLPVIVARKLAYADDLAILHYASDWQALGGTLTQVLLSLQMKAQAQFNKDCVSSCSSLQQVGTT